MRSRSASGGARRASASGNSIVLASLAVLGNFCGSFLGAAKLAGALEGSNASTDALGALSLVCTLLFDRDCQLWMLPRFNEVLYS